MEKWVIALLTVLMITPEVWPKTLADVTLVDKIVVADTTLHLNGMGLRRKLGIKVYVAGLYLVQKAHDAEEALSATGPKRFVMHYLTDRATEERMEAAWIKGFRTNSPDTYETLEDRVMTYIDFFDDLKAGDVVECTMIPGAGTTVNLNGEELGVIDGDDFQTALLRIGLGDKPPTKALKRGLLGN